VRFKIISVGWQCSDWVQQTLNSVQLQTRTDWDLMVVYDKSADDGGNKIRNWCNRADLHGKASYVLNDEQHYACRNQYVGLKLLAPEDNDIIIFLDLDGDQLAHSRVLQSVADAYEDDTLVTYGSYKPVPDEGTSSPAIPFPRDVVVANSYRNFINQPLTPTSFNHLRTMKGRVFNSIPEDQFKRENGEWYTIGTDYVFMIPALERAGGKYKCLTETLLLYNHDNPYADFRVNPGHDGVVDVLKRTPLDPLP
jgi:hypothetical protein